MPNKRMQLTKLRAAPVLQAEVPPCAPAVQMDGGTASQLIRSVGQTISEDPMGNSGLKAGPSGPAAPSESTGFYEAYVDYSRTLRTWLVAYGVGAPVLFVSNEAARKAIGVSGLAGSVAVLFLLGVFIQVLLSTVNKAAMWACYYGEVEPSFKNTKRYKVSDWVSERLWIDILCDVASIGLFATASYFVIRALVALT